MGPNGPMNPGGPPTSMPGQMPPTSSFDPSTSEASSNGATFATVKASAPNTIQYLPSRPHYNDARPRGPPNLDFLNSRMPNPDGKNSPGGPNTPNGPGPGMMGPRGGRMRGPSP